MIKVGEITCEAPEEFVSEVQEKVYKVLSDLHIGFERVDTDDAVTMEDCEAIDARLGVKTVKTLFLCNRQQTDFYLFVTRGDKPFVTRDFSRAMSISRVSFAPASMLSDMLGTHPGGASILCLVLDSDRRIKVVIDSEVLQNEWYGCNDGTSVSYMKVRTSDIMDVFLKYVGHVPHIITV